jgi:MurNAc alpha-1-phosphate uridylyltransferase
MKVMILAAGRGERLKPLTDTTPKPLIQVGKKRLIEYHLERLSACGFKEIVINVSHLGEQIQNYLGDGQNYGVKIHYSVEPEALETAGGILKAMPYLGNGPFMTVNGDILTDYPFEKMQLINGELARIVLVDNPPHVPNGDFSLMDGYLGLDGQKYTHSGITCFHPQFFAGLPVQKLSVVPLLFAAIAKKQISGEHYSGTWFDIGSSKQLETARSWLENHNGLDG